MQGIQGESIEDDGIERHKLYEDALALITGTLFVSFGVLIYAKAELLVGGVAGMALLLHYVTGGGFGFIFFVLNLPFYVLAWRRMGWKFTVRTFIAVGLVSLLSRLSAVWVDFSWLNPAYAAVIGANIQVVGPNMVLAKDDKAAAPARPELDASELAETCQFSLMSAAKATQ
jgi:uncharacterized membrane-anchored protein YitT (DUF2179 family)